MKDAKRNGASANAPSNEFTEADIEEILRDVTHEIELTGLPPYPAITLLAQRYIQPELDRQRREQEDRHDDTIGLASRDALPALLREHKRDREQLEYAQFVQIRDLASRIEEVYWDRAFQDCGEPLPHRYAAADRLRASHRTGDEMLTRTHDEDLEWLHARKDVRVMLAWPSRRSPCAVDPILGLRQLQEREWEVLKARHEVEIRVKALVLEHEQDRTLASGRSSPDSGPGKTDHTADRPRRMRRKPDLDFER